MMRVAVLMLALVLMTSCFVGGTFAKYTTGDTAADNARVAHWGVEVLADGSDLFENNYTNGDGKLTVNGSSDLVAPGTSGSTTFTIKGQPEVATKVLLNVTDIQDVFVKAGTYTATVDGETKTMVVENDYYPIKWTLTVDDNGTPVTIAENVSLAVLHNLVEDYMTGANFYAPNEQLDATFTLNWAWAFEGQDDVADTVLGNLSTDAAYYGSNEGKFSTVVKYAFMLTVEQVD